MCGHSTAWLVEVVWCWTLVASSHAWDDGESQRALRQNRERFNRLFWPTPNWYGLSLFSSWSLSDLNHCLVIRWSRNFWIPDVTTGHGTSIVQSNQLARLTWWVKFSGDQDCHQSARDSSLSSIPFVTDPRFSRETSLRHLWRRCEVVSTTHWWTGFCSVVEVHLARAWFR